MPQAQTYQSEFTGVQMDERFRAVATLAEALTVLEQAIAAKYTKPASGIPSTDMDTAVQNALALALTSVQSLADYYTKSEVDQLLAAINGMDYVDVATLPTASASTLGKIYLVGPDGSGYYAYYYTSYDGSAYSWVGPLGTTQISLANYATKAELSQLDQEVNGQDKSAVFSKTVTSGTSANTVTQFFLKAGTYKVTSNFADYVQSITLYFRDESDNNIVNKTGSALLDSNFTLAQDCYSIFTYGATPTASGTMSFSFSDVNKVPGLTDDIDKLQVDVETLQEDYLSKQKVPFIEEILLDEDSITITGTGTYVLKDLLVLPGEKVDKSAYYCFVAKTSTGVRQTGFLQIHAKHPGGTEESVASNGTTQDAFTSYCFDKYGEIGEIKFIFYASSDGATTATITGVKIYKMRGFMPSDLLDIATTKIDKYALCQHFPIMTCNTVAHRGWACIAPQNMLSAVLLAKKNGARQVENDVALSKDGKFVMWHDTTLTKLGNLMDINGYLLYTDASGNLYWYDSANTTLYTWDGEEYVISAVSLSSLTQAVGSNFSVSDFNLADLKRIDFGYWRAVKYKGETIPTFEEWVKYCHRLGMYIYIDNKLGSDFPTYAEDLVAIVRKYGMLRHCTWAVNGYYPYVRQYDPLARCLYQTAPTQALVDDEDIYAALVSGGEGSMVFSPEWDQLTRENVSLAQAKGYGIGCYYVDYFPRTTERSTIFANILSVVDLGIDHIILDWYTLEDVIQEQMLNDRYW